MKRKHLIFLLAESISLCVLCWLMKEYGHIFSSLFSFGDELLLSSEAGNTLTAEGNMVSFALSFPFSQIGFILGRLSSLGSIGNGAALSLIVLFGAVPLAAFLKTYKNKSKKAQSVILFLLWPLTTFVIFSMAKPQVIYNLAPVMTNEIYLVMKAILGGAVWSGIVCLLVLEILEKFKTANREKLLTQTKALLFALCALFASAIGYTEFSRLLEKLYNTTKAADILIAVLCFAVSALPYLLDIAVIFSGCKLIDAVKMNKDSDEISFYANRLSSLCITSLSAVVISGFIYNIVQITLANSLTNIFVNVNFPLTSLAFVMAVLILSKLVIRNIQLKEDNELFI